MPNTLLPLLLLPAIWLIRPFATSEAIDPSDTLHYVDFRGTVGYRLIPTFVAKLFVSVGSSPLYAAIFMNTLALAYLFWMLKRFSRDSQNGRSNWYWLLVVCSSPLIVIAKNNLFTDLYAGLLATHAILLLDGLRAEEIHGRRAAFKRFLLPAFLCVLAMNTKETAVLPLGAYGCLLALRPSEIAGHARACGFFLIALGLFWVAGRIAYASIYAGDPFYDYFVFWGKSKGGNVPSEIVGARASVPVPLTFYHLYGHLKIFGRYGLSALTVLLGLWFVRNQLCARIYLLGLAGLTVAGTWGYLTLERYWGAFLPVQFLVFHEVVQLLRRKRGRAAYSWLLAVAVSISSANYVFRYFPNLLQLAHSR